MSKLRVSEIYLSIQGEGPRVGHATVFIRFAGCNLRCPLWPCDTPHAIDPKIFAKDSTFMEPLEIVQKVQEVATEGTHICFTGGEPFLQNNEALELLCTQLDTAGYTVQEVFTNGTLVYPEWAIRHFYFVLDWKLAGSGENFTPEQQQARMDNVLRLQEKDVVKFTIAGENDFHQAADAWDLLLEEDVLPIPYYGVVWGKVEASQLIEWVLADPNLTEWTYSHQLHNVIWDRNKRGI